MFRIIVFLVLLLPSMAQGQGPQSFGGATVPVSVTGCQLSGCTYTGAVTFSSTINSWTPAFTAQLGVASIVAGGTDNAVGDLLTLNDGCSTHTSLAVTAVSTGAVTGVNIGVPGACSIAPTGTIAVGSTTGSGSGATFTLTYSPQGLLGITGTLANNNGNTFYGAEQSPYYLGSESVFLGDRAGGAASTGNFDTVIGHNAAGIGGGCAKIELGGTVAIGADTLRNTCGNDSVTAVGTSVLKTYQQAGTSSNHYLFGTTGVGSNALLNWNAAVAFPYNTALGDGACAGASGNQSFSTLLCLGAKTGVALTTATNSILINSGQNGFAGAFASGADVILVSTGNGNIDAPSAGASHWMNINNVLQASMQAPSYVSGFGNGAGFAGGSAAGSVGFKWNVGTGGTASSGVIGFQNAATNGWYCTARDLANPASFVEDVASTSTTSVTVTNYSRTTGLLAAWTSGDQLLLNCWGY